MSKPRKEIRHAQNRSGEEWVTRKQKKETHQKHCEVINLTLPSMKHASDLDQPPLPFNSVTLEPFDQNLRSQNIYYFLERPIRRRQTYAYFNFIAQKCDVWRLNTPNVAIDDTLIVRPPKKKPLREISESSYRRGR